jgi:hypothetical protein
LSKYQTMLNKIVTTIYVRYLNTLKEELNAYPDESKIWLVQDGINNSAGNLALHLIGNLNHFICSVLGNNGYIRNRELEFSQKGTPRNEIIASIDATVIVVEQTLAKLSSDDLAKPFPVKLPVPGDDNSTGFTLVHFTAHIAYHVGQINYHRRLIGK